MIDKISGFLNVLRNRRRFRLKLRDKITGIRYESAGENPEFIDFIDRNGITHKLLMWYDISKEDAEKVREIYQSRKQ